MFRERSGERHASSAKAELLDLEREGAYVFHGSARPDIAELEPRQARQYVAETGRHVPDGPPAVAASPYAEIAIFRALVQTGHSGFGADHKDHEGNALAQPRLSFRASQDALDDAASAVGHVYVFDRAGFVPRPGAPETSMDWRRESPVRPVRVIRVTAEDLPEEIQIM